MDQQSQGEIINEVDTENANLVGRHKEQFQVSGNHLVMVVLVGKNQMKKMEVLVLCVMLRFKVILLKIVVVVVVSAVECALNIVNPFLTVALKKERCNQFVKVVLVNIISSKSMLLILNIGLLDVLTATRISPNHLIVGVVLINVVIWFGNQLNTSCRRLVGLAANQCQVRL